MEEGYRVCEVSITRYELSYVLIPPHVELKIKCYSAEEKRAFKFKLPSGEKRLQAFLTILKIGSTDKLYDKHFQILYKNNHIYGISEIGKMEDVKYMPCTNCDDRGVEDVRLMSYNALKSQIAKNLRENKPCYLEMK